MVEYHGPRGLSVLKLLARARLQLWNGLQCRLERILLLYHRPFRLFERVVHVGRSQQNLQKSPDPRLLRGPYSLEMIELCVFQCMAEGSCNDSTKVWLVLLSHRWQNVSTAVSLESLAWLWCVHTHIGGLVPRLYTQRSDRPWVTLNLCVMRPYNL